MHRRRDVEERAARVGGHPSPVMPAASSCPSRRGRDSACRRGQDHPVASRCAKTTSLAWPAGADWSDENVLAIALYLDGSDDPDRAEDGTWLLDDDFLVLVNAWWQPLDFTIPATRDGTTWQTAIDTYDPARPATAAPLRAGGQLTVSPAPSPCSAASWPPTAAPRDQPGKTYARPRGMPDTGPSGRPGGWGPSGRPAADITVGQIRHT